MRARRLIVLVGAAVALLGVAAPAGEQDRLRWLGATRHIAVLTPAGVGSNAPLLLVLGNPGRSARYALNSWRELAEREGLIVAAISSAEPEFWSSPEDGPGFLRAVVQRVAGRHEIDRRRVYLFGAGAGGGFALSMGLLQPSYFAAVASFGGDLEPGGPFGADGLERALPIYLYLVKRDPRVGIAALQQTAAALRQSGAEVEVEELGVGADFERRGRKVAERIWNALGPHSLSGEPRYRSSPSGR